MRKAPLEPMILYSFHRPQIKQWQARRQPRSFVQQLKQQQKMKMKTHFRVVPLLPSTVVLRVWPRR